jgi:hypothetical protein
MDKIKINYNNNCANPSDINEHLPTLLKYGNECSHITEMGVRWVSSTWALLLSSPNKIISYDIVKNEKINEVIELSNEYGINYTFIESDVLLCEIEQTELLFIDTLHTYNQLTMELNLHSEKVSKYIILHDTISFGHTDEIIYERSSDVVKTQSITKTGLMNAVNDFLLTEKGKNWFIYDIYENNNGLLVLKRKN